MISTSKVIVRYAETDQMGIVHHSVYPIWFELARTDLCRKANFPYSKMEQEGVLTPLISLECKFRKPAYYEDELDVTASISKLTPARIEFYYEVYRKEDSIPISTGTTVHALTAKDLKPINTKKVHPDIYNVIQKMMEE